MLARIRKQKRRTIFLPRLLKIESIAQLTVYDDKPERKQIKYEKTPMTSINIWFFWGICLVCLGFRNTG